MTDQAAYRRYTAEAEKHLANARVPQLHLVFPEPLSAAEQAEVLESCVAQGFDRDKVVISGGPSVEDVSLPLKAAQVLATLALAAAQERVQPADRPTGPLPLKIRDGEGDIWTRTDDGLYAMGSLPEHPHWTLEKIAAQFNGYTEVT